jgi:hypothetical protein
VRAESRRHLCSDSRPDQGVSDLNATPLMPTNFYARVSQKSLTHSALPMDDRTHPLTYLPDQPIHSKREDRFNRALFAERVADTTAIRSDRSSIVIGLYGQWGRGKSSTLNLIEEALNDHSNVVVVRFNPWLYSSEERQLRGFFDTLVAAVGGSLPTKAEQDRSRSGR